MNRRGNKLHVLSAASQPQDPSWTFLVFFLGSAALSLVVEHREQHPHVERSHDDKSHKNCGKGLKMDIIRTFRCTNNIERQCSPIFISGCINSFILYIKLGGKSQNSDVPNCWKSLIMLLSVQCECFARILAITNDILKMHFLFQWLSLHFWR